MKSEIDNLFLCGAATLSHGVIGAANSGILAAAKILGCTQEDLLSFDEGQHLRTYDAESDAEWPDFLKNKRAVKRRRGAEKLGSITS